MFLNILKYNDNFTLSLTGMGSFPFLGGPMTRSICTPIDNHPPSGLGKQIRFSWVDFLEANILYLICITTKIIQFSLLDLKRDHNSVVCCGKYSCPSYTFSTKCHRLVSPMNTEILLHIWKVQVLGFSYFLSKMLYSWPLRLSDPSFGYGLLMATR